jgi:glutamine amidotransferase
VSSPLLAVVDYGAGNLHSVENALRHLGARHLVTSRPADLDGADGLVFPGVGEAASSMSVLKKTGLDGAIRRFIASGRKTLGICIGCQVVFERSEEGDTECLGILPGIVRRFPPGAGLKIPHMGWNRVSFRKGHPVFAGIPAEAEFYFVHSYYPAPADETWVAGWTDYGIRFCSAVTRGNLVAVQFHPEKSGRPGLTLLANFCRWGGNDAQ